MSVCDPGRYIGNFAANHTIDPCNKNSAIGTYDPSFNGDHTFDGGGCGCSGSSSSSGDCSGFCGKFTGTYSVVNPSSLFTSQFVTGLFELFLEETTVNIGSYYSYFINPTVNPYLNTITAQGGLNNSTYVPAGDRTQIKFEPGTGIVLNFTRSYDCFWKFSCHT
jgi:hypothetical protein